MLLKFYSFVCLCYVVFYAAAQRFWALRSGGISEHQTVNPALKPNWKTELEYKHFTPHDAKRMLAGRSSVFSDIIELLLPNRQMLVQLSP